jgi:hypothetical protein|tara:strand:- start:62 stop:199 length:138 start_codon:yes stop_codon:yes gene_type:complete
MSIITLQDYYNDSDCPELVDAFDPFLPAEELEDYYSCEDGISYDD